MILCVVLDWVCVLETNWKQVLHKINKTIIFNKGKCLVVLCKDKTEHP